MTPGAGESRLPRGEICSKEEILERRSGIMNDLDLGKLTWNDTLDWWEGSLRLSSEIPFQLYILAREGNTSERAITADARRTI